jgi:KaiC/GvpD/RAD55 family RecA-like ATPase
LDLGKALVSALLVGGRDAVHKALETGLKPEFVEGEARGAYEFLVDYVKNFDGLPGKDVIFGRTGVELPDVAEPAEFFIQETLNLRLHTLIREGVEGVADKLRERKPGEALEALEKIGRTARQEVYHQSKVVEFPILGADVLRLYERIKAGEKGILFPWPSANEETFGMWPQDLILLVGRLGSGKTWYALHIALEAWKAGKRVLFATTEMSKTKVAQRLLALYLRVSYDDLRKGRLGAFVEDKMKKAVEEMQDKRGLQVVGGDFDFHAESFSAAVDQAEPELVVLDGAYLLRVDGGTRTEKAANAFDMMKRLANSRKVPLLATHQFNRDVKANTKGSMKVEAIGLTDVAGWNADLIYGIEQTEEMKKDKWAKLKPLKMREGPGTQDLDVKNDFDSMDFSEIPRAGSAGNAQAGDEFDSGFDAAAVAGGEDPNNSGVPF